MSLKVYSIEKIRELIELSLQGTPHPSLCDTFSSRRRLCGKEADINPSTASGPPPLKGRQFFPYDLIIGGRCNGKVLHQLRMIEEAEKHGTVKVMRANEHYLDAFRYALMDKLGINPLYPVESEFDISYANHIYQMAKANAAMREAEMIDSGVITAEMICEALERLKGSQANVPIDRQVIFWHSDKTAKHASERYDGIHISRQTGNRFRKGEIINDRKD